MLAADQFIITPAGRAEEAARARAAGEEVRTVIAGYHWFTDWGRDTMISLEGLTLATGRYREAGYILRTFAHYVRDGLIPNMFPDGAREGLYHTADATLWFFHAVDRYVHVTGDADTLRQLAAAPSSTSSAIIWPARGSASASTPRTACCAGGRGLSADVDGREGGRLGRHAAARQGGRDQRALVQRAASAATAGSQQFGGGRRGSDFAAHAERARRVVQRAVLVRRGRLSVRRRRRRSGRRSGLPAEQIFAISLDHPVLDQARWQPVLKVVRERLLTPVGLRSLAPGHPDYKSQVLRRPALARRGVPPGHGLGMADRPVRRCLAEGAPRRSTGARRLLDGFDAHLSEACVGSISEIFDAEAPYTPRGCIAQAWSVAEVLRHLQKLDACST